MRTNCCHKLLAFNLKFLNFLQFFLGFSTVIYSAYLLNQWQSQAPVVPSPPSPAPPPNYLPSLTTIGGSLDVADRIESYNLGVEFVSGSEINLVSHLHFIQLPAPWYNLLKISAFWIFFFFTILLSFCYYEVYYSIINFLKVVFDQCWSVCFGEIWNVILWSVSF